MNPWDAADSDISKCEDNLFNEILDTGFLIYSVSGWFLIGVEFYELSFPVITILMQCLNYR